MLLDLINRCYICEADLYIKNPEIINKYEYRTNFLEIDNFIELIVADSSCATYLGYEGFKVN